MSKNPLPLEEAKNVLRTAAAVFGSGAFHEQVLEVLQKHDPPETLVPFSVADLIRYLSKTTWPGAWPWANQIDHLLQIMAHEGVLTQMTTGATRSPVLSRRYLLMSGLTRGQAPGDLWMTPILRVPLLVDAVQSSLIHLTGRTIEGDVRGGTGFALSPRHILTARHVIDDMTLDATIVVPQLAGDSAQVSVVKEDRHPNHDLAVVTIDGSVAELIRPRGLVTRDPGWSDTIYLLGFPPIPTSIAAATTVQKGEVVNPAITTYDGADLFLYSAVARPGNSGGPIIGLDGRLIGMVTRELSHQGFELTPASFYAGLPAHVMHTCLEDLGVGDLLIEESWE